VRNAFASEITQLGRQDDRIVLLSGDIGNRLFDEFKAKFPKRFYNCGVAEANMMGVAAGLALSGLRPVCYTITPFVTYRCMEQIRVDVCYHEAPVVIVGTGSGLSYASLGATHHSCEEMGMLRLLPGLAVTAPADALEVRALLKAAVAHPGPVYMRIGKKGEPVIHPSEPAAVIGRGFVMKPGSEVCLLCAGTVLSVGLEAAAILDAENISTRVVSFPTIKPLDEAMLLEIADQFAIVATIEEHSVLGGLGGSIAEWLADHSGRSPRLIRFGTADKFLHETCDQDEAREYFGLTARAISGGITKQWALRS
jgi:transketolase